jgi:enoyl-CoA hydratase
LNDTNFFEYTEGSMAVLVEKERPVTVVTINRPEVRNAVDRTTAEALAQAFRDFEADEEARVAVLTGTGGFFCAGADLQAMVEGRPNRVEEEGDGPMGPTRMWLNKPVVAAVAGYAVAGGLELALWCDLRVMEEDAVFGVFCRRWGVPLIDGGTVRLARLVGLSHALDMVLTGRPGGAEEALRMGLANRVVKRGDALVASVALAEQMAQFPQRCLLSDRRSVYEQWDRPFQEAMKNEFRLGLSTIQTGETLEGAGRFARGAGRHGVFGERES